MAFNALMIVDKLDKLFRTSKYEIEQAVEEYLESAK